jgi:NAD+ kinase
MNQFKTIAFVAGQTPEAREACARLEKRYGNADPAKADVIVALGGDGLMLQTLHKFMKSGKPIYGMHRGTVGFLMNEFAEEKLAERLTSAHITVIHPLLMQARDVQGRTHEHRAINEVSLFRQSAQASHLRILIDGQERLAELISDGVLVATPAGSTAYNLSAQGAIIPINAPLMALTPISPFRPRRWRGALLPDKARVTIEVLEAQKRPPTTTRCAPFTASTSAWTTAFRSTCCSIPATISTNEFCASSSVFRSARVQEFRFFSQRQARQRVARQ